MYISNFELVDELSHSGLALLAGDPTGTVVNQPKVDAAIRMASNLIDTYCYPRYAVPLTPMPELIRDLATALTIYNLYMFAKRDDLISSTIIYRKIDAIKLLNDISEGKLKLDTTPLGSQYKFKTDTKLINLDNN
jgi:phage gp36-like protein